MMKQSAWSEQNRKKTKRKENALNFIAKPSSDRRAARGSRKSAVEQVESGWGTRNAEPRTRSGGIQETGSIDKHAAGTSLKIWFTKHSFSLSISLSLSLPVSLSLSLPVSHVYSIALYGSGHEWIKLLLVKPSSISDSWRWWWNVSIALDKSIDAAATEQTDDENNYWAHIHNHNRF